MSTRPRIGQMRHLLTIEKQTLSAPDAMGAKTTTWVTHGTTYGSIEALPANPKRAELLTAGDALLVNYSPFFMRCRYLAGVLVNMRVRDGVTGQVYNITDVENVDFRNGYMNLTCKQVLL